MNTCSCGTPSEANYYLSVIAVPGSSDIDGNTEHVDGYYCTDHLPDESDWQTDMDSGKWLAGYVIGEWQGTELR